MSFFADSYLDFQKPLPSLIILQAILHLDDKPKPPELPILTQLKNNFSGSLKGFGVSLAPDGKSIIFTLPTSFSFKDGFDF